MSHIWPDAEFNDKANGVHFTWMGPTVIKVCIGLHVFYQMSAYLTAFDLTV